MRFGTLWRAAVLASLALLTSGQLCMLTTCVPRLTPHRVAQHACCHAVPEGRTPAGSPASTAVMPCDQAMHAAGAPTLSLPLASVAATAWIETPATLLAAPARGSSPRTPFDTGPAPGRHSPAPAGLRAPPQG